MLSGQDSKCKGTGCLAPLGASVSPFTRQHVLLTSSALWMQSVSFFTARPLLSGPWLLHSRAGPG